VGDRLDSALHGKRVVITRAEAQSGELLEALSSRRAISIVVPLVEFAALADYGPLDAALRRMQTYDWLLFTSVNAVQAVSARQRFLGAAQRAGGNFPNVAAVGPATRRAAEESGFQVAYVAKNHLGVALAEELGEQLAGKQVFLPRSDRANRDLPAALQRLGAEVTEVVAYRTIRPAGVDRDSLRKLTREQADAILFFSPTAVHHFAELLDDQRNRPLEIQATLAAVGPVTLAALREAGLDRSSNPVIMASDTGVEAVVDALEEHFAKFRERSPAGTKSA
jgi:uroporphyrinogen III methyltransferase / synthase